MAWAKAYRLTIEIQPGPPQRPRPHGGCQVGQRGRGLRSRPAEALAVDLGPEVPGQVTLLGLGPDRTAPRRGRPRPGANCRAPSRDRGRPGRRSPAPAPGADRPPRTRVPPGPAGQGQQRGGGHGATARAGRSDAAAGAAVRSPEAVRASATARPTGTPRPVADPARRPGPGTVEPGRPDQSAVGRRLRRPPGAHPAGLAAGGGAPGSRTSGGSGPSIRGASSCRGPGLRRGHRVDRGRRAVRRRRRLGGIPPSWPRRRNRGGHGATGGHQGRAQLLQLGFDATGDDHRDDAAVTSPEALSPMRTTDRRRRPGGRAAPASSRAPSPSRPGPAPEGPR